MSMALCLLAMLYSITPVNAADPNKGSEIFRQHCVTCHAPGRPMPGTTDFLQGRSLFQPDPVLLEKIKTGRNAMPAYNGILSDIDILNIIAYLRTL